MKQTLLEERTNELVDVGRPSGTGNSHGQALVVEDVAAKDEIPDVMPAAEVMRSVTSGGRAHVALFRLPRITPRDQLPSNGRNISKMFGLLRPK